MTDAPDNPHAFPRTGEGFGNPMYDAPGMTLRDWFAGQALVGLLASTNYSVNPQGFTGDVVFTAGKIADAMLAARTAKP